MSEPFWCRITDLFIKSKLTIKFTQVRRDYNKSEDFAIFTFYDRYDERVWGCVACDEDYEFEWGLNK